MTRVVQVSCAEQMSIYLTESGLVWVNGANTGGQIGLGPNVPITNPTNILVPTLIPTIQNITKVSTLRFIFIAVTENGDLYTWGRHVVGEGGWGQAPPIQNRPRYLPTISNVVDVSSLRYQSVFRLVNGSFYAMGQSGGLGVGDKENRFVPSPVLGLEGKTITKFCSGFAHTMYQTDKNELYATGSNFAGQTGLGDTGDLPLLTPIYVPISFQYPSTDLWCGYSGTFVNSPVGFWYVGTLEDSNYSPKTVYQLQGSTTKISVGFQHTLFLNDQQEVFAAGSNLNGEVGIGPTGITQVGLPKRVAINDPIVDMSALLYFSVFLTAKGEVYTAGSNDFGSIGVGNATIQYTPIKVPIDEPVVALSPGLGFHVIVRTASGNLLGWGRNDAGQLGLGHYNFTNSPTNITTLKNIIQVSVGPYHTLFLDSNGTAYGVGSEHVYSTGLSSRPNMVFDSWDSTDFGIVPCVSTPFSIIFSNESVNITRIQAGMYHSLFMDSLGQLWGVGSSARAELFEFLGINRGYRVPFILSHLLPNITRFAGGDQTTLIEVNNTLHGFGFNSQGQLGLGYLSVNSLSVETDVNPPPKIFNAQKIIDFGCGQFHCVALTSCPNGKAGVNCEFDTCFGLSAANDAYVCSGQGSCVGLDKCSCIAPSEGDQCQFSQYKWKRLSNPFSTWTNSDNWQIQRRDKFFNTLTYPRSSGDSVAFIEDGNWNIEISDPNLQLGKIVFGGPNARYNLDIKPGAKIEMLRSLQMTDSITITANGAKIISKETTLIKSVTTWINCEFTGNFTIEKGAVMNITGGSLISAYFKNFGVLNILPGSSGVLAANEWVDTTMIQEGTLNFQATITGSRSNMLNLGQIYFLNSTTNTLLVDVENQGKLSFYGEGRHIVGKIIQTRPTAELLLSNSNLVVNAGINITSGVANLGGSITTSMLSFSSADGFLDVLSKLNIVGNIDFQDQATLFLVIGKNIEQTDQITVTGSVQMDSFIVLSAAPDYTPIVGDIVPFLISNSTIKSKDVPQNIYLIGTLYRNAQLRKGTNKFDFEIIFSSGSVANLGYVCHYLGKQKVLEMNRLDSQKKIVISLTVPRRSSLIGFGFDLNGHLNNSMLSLSNGSSLSITQYQHGSIKAPPFILTTISEAKSIFIVGPPYFTITLFVPITALDTQKFIYYAEINNGTNSTHYFETYPFKVGTDKTAMNAVACTNFLQPSRAEVNENYVGLIVMQAIYVIIFVLCIVFSRWRPMNTRGISPALTVFLLFAQLMLEVRNYFEIPEYQASLCLYLSLGYYPLNLIVFVTMFLYFLRYFAIINLNQNKQNLYKKVQIGQKAKTWLILQTRFLKVITSWVFTISLIVLSYLAVVAIYIIILGGFQFECKFQTLIAVRIVNSLELITVYLLTILSLVGDMIPNYQMFIKFKWGQYVFGDPYWFRAQVFLFIPFMFYSLAVELFSLIGSSDYLGVVTNFKTQTILNTINAQLLLILNVLFPMVLTVIYMITSLFQKKSDKNALEKALHDPNITVLLAEYCQQEFAIENYAIWKDIETFKATSDVAKREKIAEEIYAKYLAGASAVMEVNVPQSVCKVIKGKMDERLYPDDIYEELMKNVIANLSDTWCRFISSNAYVQYYKNENATLEMLEGKQVKIPK